MQPRELWLSFIHVGSSLCVCLTVHTNVIGQQQFFIVAIHTQMSCICAYISIVTSICSVCCMYNIVYPELSLPPFYVLKLALLGDTYVAKTSIMMRYCCNSFDSNSGFTIGLLQHCFSHLRCSLQEYGLVFTSIHVGVNFMVKDIKIGQRRAHLQIWYTL